MQFPRSIWVMAARVPNPKQQACINYYLGEANRNASQAARLAGYRSARVMGPGIIKKFRHLIDQADAKAQDAMSISLKETMDLVASLCRDKTHKDHVVGLRLALQVHGALGDKAAVGDLKGLRAQLEEILKQQPAAQPKSKPKSNPTDLKLVLQQIA